MSFVKEIDNIYRLKIPFESVYTSVFLIREGNKNILVDCATTADDVNGYIIPALEEIGLTIKDINFLVITHPHSDHAGGKARLLEYYAQP
jgi:glyoxylase-like metal-dependent hydrolase (beta-lactamase superfamily II)